MTIPTTSPSPVNRIISLLSRILVNLFDTERMIRGSTRTVEHQWRPMEQLKQPLGHWLICIYRYGHLIVIIVGNGDEYGRILVNIYDIRTWTKLKIRGTTILSHTKTTHTKTTTTMGQATTTTVEGGYLTIHTCGRRESVCQHNSLLRQTEGRIIENSLPNMLHPAMGPGSTKRGSQSTMLLVLPPTCLLISDVSLLNSTQIVTLIHELLFNVHLKGHQMLIDPACIRQSCRNQLTKLRNMIPLNQCDVRPL